MSFEGDFRALALGQAAVNSALGGRLYLARLPKQPEYPCGVFRVVSETLLGDHETAGDEMSERRVQVDLYARDGAGAVACQVALKAALSGAAETAGQTVFCELWWASALQLYEEALEVYRYSCDLMVTSRPL